MEQSGTSRLCVGAIGERWLDAPSGAIASPYLAPETLVAALPIDAKRWVFIGRHGSRFWAATPLGAFTSVQRPPQKYAQFSIVGGNWYGITSEGELWRGPFDDLRGAKLTLPTPIFDFAITPSGSGMAIGIPERLWTTRNQGTQWEALKMDPVGATHVSVGDAGGFNITALLLPVAQAPTGVAIHDAKEARGHNIRLRYEPALFTAAEGFVEGRSVAVASRVIELRKFADGWRVGSGSIDKPFEFAKTRGLEGCTAVQLALAGQSSLALCRSDSVKDGSNSLAFYRSDNRAQDFAKLAALVQGRFNDVHLVAISGGHFVATGLCAASVSERAVEPILGRTLVNAKTVRDCVPKSVVDIKLSESLPNGRLTVKMEPVSAPGAHITAQPVAVSSDGQLVAFVSRGDSTKPWSLYFSDDAGRTFGARSIDVLPVTNAVTQPKSRAIPPSARRESRTVQSLKFGEDRSLSLVLRDGDSPIVVNFDDRGNVVATTLVPPGVSRVDAVGTRILGVSLTERAVYESLDRGASFELVGHLPAAACLTALSCPVVCTSFGCLIGERFTRVSWGGRGDAVLDIAGDAEELDPGFEPQTERVMFRTPLVCQPSASAPVVSAMARPPLPEQIGLTDVLWYGPWQDWSKASAGLVRAMRGHPVVEQMLAFEPLAHPERAGLAVNFSDAGVAYMRSKQLPKVGDALSDLELAWVTFKRPNWARARFRDVTPISSSDSYVYNVERARRLLPAQMTVFDEGIFLNAHADDPHQLGSYFVTVNSSAAVGRIPWPVERVRDAQIAREGNAWVGFAFDETGSILLRAQKLLGDNVNGSPWKFLAQTVANPRALDGLDRAKIYWGGKRPMLVLGTAARGHQLQSLTAYELPPNWGPLSAAAPLPLPASLSEPPPACTARDRHELTRVVVPLLPAAARAIGIKNSQDQLRWLVASHASMYVSPARACLDALWAETLPGTTPMHAVVPLDEPVHAWSFSTRRTKGEAKVDIQAMSCKFDASANPPPEFETRTQARFNLERLPLSE